MRLPFSLAFACAAVLLCGSARVSELGASGASVPATIHDVSWIAGHWEGEGMGGFVEDAWMPPKDGAMLGSLRFTRVGSKRGFYELGAIEEHNGGLRLITEHFSQDWSERRSRKKALKLRLTRLSRTEAVFGPITIKREGPDTRIVEFMLSDKTGAARPQAMRLTRRTQLYAAAEAP
jgi:hypothetical protein